jgi:hypothetical protein
MSDVLSFVRRLLADCLRIDCRTGQGVSDKMRPSRPDRPLMSTTCLRRLDPSARSPLSAAWSPPASAVWSPVPSRRVIRLAAHDCALRPTGRGQRRPAQCSLDSSTSSATGFHAQPRHGRAISPRRSRPAGRNHAARVRLGTRCSAGSTPGGRGPARLGDPAVRSAAGGQPTQSPPASGGRRNNPRDARTRRLSCGGAGPGR